jgi:hypothetical protein
MDIVDDKDGRSAARPHFGSNGRSAVSACGNRGQLFRARLLTGLCASGGQPQECERRVDLALEDFGPGRRSSEDQFLVRIAKGEMNDLLGHDRRRCGIELFRQQLGDRGPERSIPRLP